ncbi:hypothetical protein DXB51_14375 [Bacillus cereus]|nr:pyocin knob domain-containing protein [Bacillus luti]RGN77178.1 hypothetical protein DXB51_14375 [Bacillus cereus]
MYPSWLNWNGYTFNLAAGTDLDTVVKSGLYGGSGLVNAPVSIYLYIEVIAFHDTKYVLQRATSLAGGGVTNQATWVRRLENNVWGAWERLIDSKGGTINGPLTIEGNRDLTFKNDNAETVFRNNSSGIFAFYDKKNDFIPWSYNPADKRFSLGAVNTNIMKNTGGAVTGDVIVDVANKGFKVGNATEGLTQSVDINGKYYWYATSTKTPLQYDIKTDNFVVNAENTNLITKRKDGRAQITVSADAELIGPNGVVADRRGNTVTLRAPIRRKLGSTNGVVFTLPADMRPSMLLTQTVFTNDGSPALLTISATNGEVLLQTLAATIVGKDINITITYVVD